MSKGRAGTDVTVGHARAVRAAREGLLLLGKDRAVRVEQV